MRFGDLFDPDRGPQTLMKLALVPFLILIAWCAITAFLASLSATDALLALLFLALMSPLAYFIRQARLGRPRREGRRGAERTPVLPHRSEEDR